ncbi:MAG: DUF4124 domain-containing protein [Deltaproteobacteria bacterium]
MNRILIAALIALIAVSAEARTIYKWVDRDGSVHYTDNPENIPQERRPGAEAIENAGGDSENFRTEESAEEQEEGESAGDAEIRENEGREREIREFWRGRALELERRERFILQAIENTKEQIKQKQREVNYMLINGFAADFSILELKSHEDSLEGFKSELILISAAKAALRDEARRRGIPAGYLRP